MMKRILLNERGFSTVELLVAMQVMALVAGLAFGYFLFVQKFHKKWETRNRLQVTAVTDIEHLAGAVRNADRITAATGSRLELIDVYGKKRVYTLRDHRLFAGEQCLTPPQVTVTDVAFTYKSGNRDLDDNLDGTVDETELDRDGSNGIDAVEARQIQMLDISLTYHSGTDDFSVSQCVMMRNPGALL